METIIKEKIIPVWGTTKLCVGDPYYLINIKNGTDKGRMKDLVFDGSISAAKNGKMRIALRHYSENDLEFDMITVTIVQGSEERMLDVYLEGKYFKNTLKEQKELGCDTACFEITTKFGFDNFGTGADGYYGTLCKYKQYYGMKLNLSFYANLFSFDEIEKRIFVAEFKIAAENYDVDEEVEIFAQSRGKNGVPSSIKTLCDDMQEAKDTLMDLVDKLEAVLEGRDIHELIVTNQMNKDEFMQYIDENYSCDGSAKRLIKNILNYVETNIVGENEQYLALCELLNGTIGLSDSEIKKIYL